MKNTNSRRFILFVILAVVSVITIASHFIVLPSFRPTFISDYCGPFERFYSKPVEHKDLSLGRKRLLYVFMSINTKPERNDMIRQNIEHIVIKNSNNTRYQIDCILYGYVAYEEQPQWVKDMEKLPNPVCDYIKVYKQNYVYFLKSISPFFIEKSQYDYLTFVLDDVVHYEPHGNVDIIQYFDIVFQNNLGIASPSVIGSSWSSSIGPRPVNATMNQVGRHVQMIEMQATTFRPDFWRCFYELIDTQFPSGWGIDLWFYDYCITSGRVNGTMGIVDTMHVHHNPFGFPSTHQGSDTSFQVKNFLDFKGIQLKETMNNPGGDFVPLLYFNEQL